jgi:hypothetical protein
VGIIAMTNQDGETTFVLVENVDLCTKEQDAVDLCLKQHSVITISSTMTNMVNIIG